MRRFKTFEYRGPDSFYRWLVGILLNKIHHAARDVHQPSKTGTPTLTPGLLDAIGASQTSVGGRVANAELESHVKGVIEQLPPDLRDILILRVYESRSGRESAAILGIHESTASVRFKAAIQRCESLMPRESE